MLRFCHSRRYADRDSASACMRPRWAAFCANWGSRGRKRGRAICKRTWPLERPLKRAPALLRKIQYAHKGKRVRLFFQDEARIGQKGRTCHIWWKRGERPPGLAGSCLWRGGIAGKGRMTGGFEELAKLERVGAGWKISTLPFGSCSTQRADEDNNQKAVILVR